MPPGPDLPADEVKWRDQISQEVMFSASNNDFAPAWYKVVKQIRELFEGRFGRWCEHAIRSVGVDRFADAPDPPVNVGRESGHPDRTHYATFLTGSNDIAEAGRRIIFWAAANLEPLKYRRVEAFPELVAEWCEHLIWIWPECCTVAYEPLDWVELAFQQLSTTVAPPPELPTLETDSGKVSQPALDTGLFSPAEELVLEVICAAGSRLTTDEVLAKLTTRHGEASPGNIK